MDTTGVSLGEEQMPGGLGIRWQRWGLATILLLAFVLRLYRLGADSLWYDETVSVHLASKSVPALLAHTAGDIHPPGYYLLLHGWVRLAGSSDYAVAFLSLFFGMLLVPLAYRLAVRLAGPPAGLFAALLVGISPYNLWYSQEVRMYTLGAVLAMGLLFALLSLLQADSALRPRWRLLAACVLCGAAGLWVLYYFAFLLLAVNLLVLAWWLARPWRHRARWAWLGWWALAQGATLLLYAPWLPVAWRQATQPPVPAWRGFTALGPLLVETWTALSLGQSAEPRQVWPILLLVAALFGLGVARRPLGAGRLPVRGAAWLVAAAVFLPLLLIYLASFLSPLYHVRYAFTYSTPFYVILGSGLDALRGRVRPARWASLAAIVIFCGSSVYAYHTDPRFAPDDHRAAVRFLAEAWRPGDAILVNAGYAYTAVLTYWNGEPITWRGRLVGDPHGDFVEEAGRGPVLIQTGTVDGDSSLGWGEPDSDFYAMAQSDTAASLARLFAAFDRVWVYRCYDTVTDATGLIRGWLDEHGLPFEDRIFRGESQLRVQGFLTGRDPLANAGQPHDAALAAGALRLQASSPMPASLPVGGALDLALVWRVDSPLSGDEVLFAGLSDVEGNRWAQADEHPLGSLYPTSAWPVGAIVRTPLRVPVESGTAPGRYRLDVGWYRFTAGQPIWLGDVLALAEVDIVSPGDWALLLLPAPAHPLRVTIGPDVQLLGFDAPSLEGRPGETLQLDLFWQALADGPGPGQVILQLTDDTGQVLTESASAPVGGRVPFASLASGQALRDPQSLALPADLAPGVYDLTVGRRRADGAWLPVRRGAFARGWTCPLATVRVLGRTPNRTPPVVEHPLDARFGNAIRLVGYDVQPSPSTISSARRPAPDLELTLHWLSLAPVDTHYKIFVHLVLPGARPEIRAQADVYTRLPTTSWLPGEYLADRVHLDLPPSLPPGDYALLLGLYDEATGARLPLLDAGDRVMGDSLVLERLHLEP